MNMTEAANGFVAVKIARLPRTFGLGVRTKVHHPEWTRRRIKIEPARFVCINQRIDELSQVLRLLSRDACRQYS